MTFKSDFAKFIKGVEQDAKQAGSASALKQLGNYALRLIRDRTRDGFGVKKVGGPEKELKKLSPRYIKARRGMKLSQFTSPSTSNLTLTGAMLASLRVFTKNFQITIHPTGSDRKGISNQKKADWNEEKGRVFLRLSDTEIKAVTDFYNNEILTKTIK